MSLGLERLGLVSIPSVSSRSRDSDILASYFSFTYNYSKVQIYNSAKFAKLYINSVTQAINLRPILLERLDRTSLERLGLETFFDRLVLNVSSRYRLGLVALTSRSRLDTVTPTSRSSMSTTSTNVAVVVLVSSFKERSQVK